MIFLVEAEVVVSNLIYSNIVYNNLSQKFTLFDVDTESRISSKLSSSITSRRLLAADFKN